MMLKLLWITAVASTFITYGFLRSLDAVEYSMVSDADIIEQSTNTTERSDPHDSFLDIPTEELLALPLAELQGRRFIKLTDAETTSSEAMIVTLFFGVGSLYDDISDDDAARDSHCIPLRGPLQTVGDEFEAVRTVEHILMSGTAQEAVTTRRCFRASPMAAALLERWCNATLGVSTATTATIQPQAVFVQYSKRWLWNQVVSSLTAGARYRVAAAKEQLIRLALEVIDEERKASPPQPSPAQQQPDVDERDVGRNEQVKVATKIQPAKLSLLHELSYEVLFRVFAVHYMLLRAMGVDEADQQVLQAVRSLPEMKQGTPGDLSARLPLPDGTTADLESAVRLLEEKATRDANFSAVLDSVRFVPRVAQDDLLLIVFRSRKDDPLLEPIMQRFSVLAHVLGELCRRRVNGGEIRCPNRTLFMALSIGDVGLATPRITVRHGVEHYGEVIVPRDAAMLGVYRWSEIPDALIDGLDAKLVGHGIVKVSDSQQHRVGLVHAVNSYIFNASRDDDDMKSTSSLVDGGLLCALAVGSPQCLETETWSAVHVTTTVVLALVTALQRVVK